MANPAIFQRYAGGTRSDDKKWTVMVFMGADNLPEEGDLTQAARDDIKEMSKVADVDHLNLFIQVHGKGSVFRQHMAHGDGFEVSEDEQDATNGKALLAFVEWALKTAGHRETDYSMLILWGHAYRFAIGHRKVGGVVDALDFAELRTVLEKFQEKWRKVYEMRESPKLDIVAFDACDIATVEMSYQLHPFARYLIASQVGIPLPGWPYDRVLDRLQKPYGRPMGPAELGSYVVRRFCEHYRAENRAVSLTVLDLEHAPTLLRLTEQLARKLAIAMSGDASEREIVKQLFLRSRVIDDYPKPFVDVADLCLNLALYSNNDDVVKVAQEFGDFLLSPRPVVPHASEKGVGKPFVVDHGRNAVRGARLNGVSLYAPHVAGRSHDWPSSTQRYGKFALVQKTIWNQLVQTLAQMQ